jgi:hypothetical protein
VHYLDVCREGLRKIMKNLRIAGVPAEIRTEYIRNRSLDSATPVSSVWGSVLEGEV